MTVIPTGPFEDEEAARAWLDACRGRGDHGSEAIAEAIVHLNRAIAAYRVAAADPLARDLTVHDAVRVRLGYGSGQEMVEGGWHDCYVIPAGRRAPRTRRRMLAPEQELAGILGGHRPLPRPSEELTLRARLDLDHDRYTEAALQARAAAQALWSELEESERNAVDRLADETGRLARAALEDGLGEEDLVLLEALVTKLERTTRRRRYSR